MKFKHLLIIVLAVVMTGAIVSCGKYQTTARGAYAIAQDEFIGLQESYIAAFKVADPVTKEKYREKVSPLFNKADDALDSWGLAIIVGNPTEMNQAEFNNIRRQLLNAILEVEDGN